VVQDNYPVLVVFNQNLVLLFLDLVYGPESSALGVFSSFNWVQNQRLLLPPWEHRLEVNLGLIAELEAVDGVGMPVIGVLLLKHDLEVHDLNLEDLNLVYVIEGERDEQLVVLGGAHHVHTRDQKLELEFLLDLAVFAWVQDVQLVVVGQSNECGVQWTLQKRTLNLPGLLESHFVVVQFLVCRYVIFHVTLVGEGVSQDEVQDFIRTGHGFDAETPEFGLHVVLYFVQNQTEVTGLLIVLQVLGLSFSKYLVCLCIFGNVDRYYFFLQVKCGCQFKRKEILNKNIVFRDYNYIFVFFDCFYKNVFCLIVEV